VISRRISFLILAGSFIAGCTAAKPFLLQGNATSAEVGYSGDVDDATLVARKHCSQYERVPRFLEAEENVAFFDCVRP